MLRRRWRSSRSVAVVSGIPGVRASPIDSRVNSTSGHAGPAGPATTLRRVSRVLLGLILIGGFALRIWNNDYGLPYVWSLDEGTHFASRSVEMFWQDFDPGYYQNPAAYTYLVYGLLRVDVRAARLRSSTCPSGTSPSSSARTPPRSGWPPAPWPRCSAWWAWWPPTGPRGALWGAREGLVAAAVLSFAFLPVAYSRVAVTDVGSMIGVALALYGSVRAHEEGRLRHYALAGAAAGLAMAFKYTAGLALLPAGHRGALPAAGRPCPRRGRPGRRCGRSPRWCSSCSTPTWPGPSTPGGPTFATRPRWPRTSRSRARTSGGAGYYLESLSWGLGWAARAGGAGGGRDRAAAPPGARADPGRGAGGAVRLPEPAGPLLRALAAARLPGAGHAGRGGARARRGRAPGAPRARCRFAPPPWRPRGGGAGPAAWPPTCARPWCSAARTPASRRATGSRTAIRRSCAWRSSRRCPGATTGRTRTGACPPWLSRCPARDGWTSEGLRLRRSRRAAGVRAVQAGPVRASGRGCSRLRLPPRALPRGGGRLPPLRLLPGDDGGGGARARARDRGAPGAGLLPPPRAGVPAAPRVQPLRPGRRSGAVQLRPLLQLLPHGLPSPRPRRADLPAAGLQAGLRAAADPDPQGPRAAAVRAARGRAPDEET